VPSQNTSTAACHPASSAVKDKDHAFCYPEECILPQYALSILFAMVAQSLLDCRLLLIQAQGILEKFPGLQLTLLSLPGVLEGHPSASQREREEAYQLGISEA
jgi:hypothetical protein